MSAVEPAACVGRLNAESQRIGGEQRVVVLLDGGRLVYRIGKVREAYLATQTYEQILALAKSPAGRATDVDLGECRTVSSLELTLIGYLITQTRFHGGAVRVVNANRVVQNALRMVGFEGLVEVDQGGAGSSQQTQLRP